MNIPIQTLRTILTDDKQTDLDMWVDIIGLRGKILFTDDVTLTYENDDYILSYLDDTYRYMDYLILYKK